MTDFEICMGTSDVPTPLEVNHGDVPSHTNLYSQEEIQEKIANGFIQDSNGRWYDPTNYIDSLYANW